MSEKIGIIGGAGMIGSHVAAFLKENGYDPILFDNFSAYDFDVIKAYGLSKFRLVKGDIRDPYELDKFIGKCTRIVHLASLADVGACIRNPDMNFNIDIIGTNNVLKFCMKHKIKKVVFASSASVYGSPRWVDGKPPMVSEDSVLHPTTPYANTKLFNEQQFRLVYEHYGLPTTSLRYFSVYGDHQVPKPMSHSWCVAIFTMLAMKKKTINIYGDGKQIRDFTHVSDIARATVECLFNEKTDGQIINVGTGIPTSINECADEVFRNILRTKVNYTPVVKGDPLGCYADNRLMKKLLGWVPKCMFEDGVEQYIQWVRKNQELIPKWL